MYINLPPPESEFDKQMVFQLQKYLTDIYAKVSQQQGSAWNGNHPVMGSYHLWIDSSGRLRVKSSKPTSDTDGTVVGTQV